MVTWKRIKLTTIFTLFFVVAMFAYNVDYVSKSNHKLSNIERVIQNQNKNSTSSYEDLNKEIEQIKKENKDSLDEAIQLKNKENSIYVKFKSRNRFLNKDLAHDFLKATEAFNLGQYDKSLDVFISQLLHESGGYQYYPSNHGKKSNQLVIGTSGEIGIGQIMPRTAHFLIKYHITSGDRKKMLDAGADNFDHLDHKGYDQKTKEQTIKWLSKRSNNLIMWSYVVTYYTNCNHGNITRGLVAYNKGQGGLRKYIKNGGVPSQYTYYKAIKKIQKDISSI